jgi:type I restriction enzyme M protein
MAKKEAKTDLWVYDLLKDAKINLDPQGSSIKEIEEALKTASKSKSGNVGRPEYVGVVKDFIIVIEDKKDLSKHIKKITDDVISQEIEDIKNYAVNGALWYGKHLVKNTSYKKVLAFGVSGDEKRHQITPIFINERGDYKILDDVESFISFNEKNIDEYYIREILKEETDYDKELKEILKDAKELHEDLRNYGNLKDIDKPLIVSGILLALRERDYNNFSIDKLTGDSIKTDGQKIFEAIESHLKRVRVAPEVKRDKILSQFSIIKDMKILNEINSTLNKTPLRHFAEFLDERIYKSIRYTNSSEDYLGRFYGEFMSYSGGDGQTLGIVLTPKHITDLFCELVDIKPDDVVLDPTAGTGGFLIAAMHHMLKKAEDENQKENIKQNQLFGIELQPYMFTIATTNMILRGDGKSNLINEDFFKLSSEKIQLWGATVGFMNPPYSQGSKRNPHLYEISFIERLLDSLTPGAKAVVIVPQSTMTGKTKIEKEIKANILKYHTLEGVITLNPDTFYGIGVMPVIAVFTAHKPHPKEKIVKFIDFRDDGYVVNKHIGLVETEAAKDKRQHLLDVWFDRVEAPTKFCVKTTIEANDEWLHSFFYFNDEIPTVEEFEKTVSDYLIFEFSMIMQGREYLFDKELP